MLSADASHLRKYLATLGVAIFAATVSLAGLAMRVQAELLVKQSELALLTPTARHTIERRQHYASVVTAFLPCMLLLGCLLGIGLAVYGISGWAKRQQVADDIEDSVREEKLLSVRALTDAERLKRLEDEATDVGLGEDAEEAKTPEDPTGAEGRKQNAGAKPGSSDAPTNGPSGGSGRAPEMRPGSDVSSAAAARRRHDEIMQRVLDAEVELGDKAEEAFGATHSVERGVRVAAGSHSLEFDVVATPKDESGRVIVFELKHARHVSALRNSVTRVLVNVVTGAELLKPAIPVVIGVYQDATRPEEVERAQSAVNDFTSTLNSSLRIKLLHEDEFHAMTPDTLRRIVAVDA